MKRSDLEHIIRAAGAISNEREIIIIGSQAILGEFPNASPLLVRSSEADVYPRLRPELAELIEGSIGEGSAFHESFGYYAQGVGQDTAVLPADWQRRLIAVNNANTHGYTGLCLEVHDLAISKYVAGREKDLEFTRELAKHRMTDPVILRERLKHTPVSDTLRSVVAGRIERDFATLRKKPSASAKRRAKRAS